MTTFTAPEGKHNSLCADILKQPHVLIAGATGSGKSVLINSIIYNALLNDPSKISFVLIDPKRVELNSYRNIPHTIRYASEPEDIVAALQECVKVMDIRYAYMQNEGLKKYPHGDVYIIIDEFADLMTMQKKQTLMPLCRLAQLGRAAGLHLILATQRPTRDIINGQIKVNIDARIALRCPTAQDSRNIINISGAEKLPRYGKGYYLTPETMQPEMVDIPMTEEAELNRVLNHWNSWRSHYWTSSYDMRKA